MSIETCRHCNATGVHRTEVQQSGVHYAKVTCNTCDRFLRWIPKPDSDPTKARRPQQHRELVRAYGNGFCEMCLRKTDELPKGQTLEAQHVIEFQDGGSNDRSNIWIICTACHKLVHWTRYYHGGDFKQLLEMVGRDVSEL